MIGQSSQTAASERYTFLSRPVTYHTSRYHLRHDRCRKVPVSLPFPRGYSPQNFLVNRALTFIIIKTPKPPRSTSQPFEKIGGGPMFKMTPQSNSVNTPDTRSRNWEHYHDDDADDTYCVSTSQQDKLPISKDSPDSPGFSGSPLKKRKHDDVRAISWSLPTPMTSFVGLSGSSSLPPIAPQPSVTLSRGKQRIPPTSHDTGSRDECQTQLVQGGSSTEVARSATSTVNSRNISQPPNNFFFRRDLNANTWQLWRSTIILSLDKDRTCAYLSTPGIDLVYARSGERSGVLSMDYKTIADKINRMFEGLKNPFYNKPDFYTSHAELKLIAWYMHTHNLSVTTKDHDTVSNGKSAQRSSETRVVFIGVSKEVCVRCDSFIRAVNDWVLTRHGITFWVEERVWKENLTHEYLSQFVGDVQDFVQNGSDVVSPSKQEDDKA
ncbi:hypothetical protein P154DRAFT_622850 [Amniculicola lignicola CBS 123094]|uniref:Uncharacterized protein n=1 Tax=Amniculicola lignicola CBS 123094 TaxID=1392246 RepID=A0A6A5W4W8_9PLEO|nr:hypothetical protein P154DRAFT_622850 [Amniculicola lignicola CBS 123094]